MNTKSLHGRVAVVTGASRGVGKGIAHELGLAGATVIVTGRSTANSPPDPDRPGSIEETAALITEAGGRGVALQCDHTCDDEVKELFNFVRTDLGKLDLLVNNVWGGYEGHEGSIFSRPFWEQDMSTWNTMFDAGLRAHFTASFFAAPLMIARKSGLIITITVDAGDKYTGNVMYDTCKKADERMVFAMAQELAVYNIAAVAVYPGHTRTERVVSVLERTMPDFDWAETNSPRYVGRAVVALTADVDIMQRTGSGLHAGEAAEQYGFTDIDGRLVPPFRL